MSLRLRHFLLPGGLIVLVAALLAFRVELGPGMRAFWPFYPFLVLGGGLFLGWRFRRSRLIFALLVLALADRALAWQGGRPGVVAAVLLLLPLNLAAIGVYRERGLVTPLGLLRLGLIAVQLLLAGYALDHWPRAALALLQRPLLAGVPAGLLPGSLPQAALAALLLAEVVLFLVFWFRPEPLSGGLIWALPIAFFPLAFGRGGAGPTLGLATAGLVLVAAVLETSHGMAYRDDLTGLPARRALNEAMLKMGRRYAVAMVDIDHFKKVNDRYGHDVGDQVLKMVAKRLGKVAGGGQPFRYGGEEFTVLFPGKGAEEALPYLDHLRRAIENSAFTLRHRSRPKDPEQKVPRKVGSEQLAVTVSIGVAERGGDLNQSGQVLKAADQALYRAKRSGRNRICGGDSCGGKRGKRGVPQTE